MASHIGNYVEPMRVGESLVSTPLCKKNNLGASEKPNQKWGNQNLKIHRETQFTWPVIESNDYNDVSEYNKSNNNNEREKQSHYFLHVPLPVCLFFFCTFSSRKKKKENETTTD